MALSYNLRYDKLRKNLVLTMTLDYEELLDSLQFVLSHERSLREVVLVTLEDYTGDRRWDTIEELAEDVSETALYTSIPEFTIGVSTTKFETHGDVLAKGEEGEREIQAVAQQFADSLNSDTKVMTEVKRILYDYCINSKECRQYLGKPTKYTVKSKQTKTNKR